MKILAIGDVVGEQTLPYLRRTLPLARKEYAADLVIANGENVCDVHGLSPLTAQALFDAGVDFITSGNHIFDRRDAHQMLEDATHIVRPCNYPAECPGEGSKMITSQDGSLTASGEKEPIMHPPKPHSVAASISVCATMPTSF